jgi:molecular chaperone GrpE
MNDTPRRGPGGRTEEAEPFDGAIDQEEEIGAPASVAPGEVNGTEAADAGETDAHDGASELAEKHRDLTDRHLRLAAEFENFRKRTAREWTERVQSANAELLFDLLAIADNFERALQVEHAESAYADGVRMIFQQLQGLLARRGVEAIPALGQPFDPNLHEALIHMASDEYEEGLVCQEIRKGYRLRDRVFRPAQVAVSSGPKSSADDA